jgi:hypothetical protein
MLQDLPSLIALPGDAVRWIDAHLPAACRAAETVRQTVRSTVVRLTTDEGIVYFKADHILPPPEAAIVGRLARHSPYLVPRVVAVEETQGWSLTLDAGSTGPTSLDDQPTGVWRAIARAFGMLQRNTGHGPDDWVAIGCRDLRGPRRFEALRAMIEHASPGLETSDQNALRRLLPRIEEACDDLSHDGVPATLVHQDLVPENLIWNAGQVVFLDWSDTVVGHPFFGLDRLLDFCWNDADRKAAVIADYLTGFEEAASPERLRRSFDRVLWLRVLYEDLRWHHEILALPSASEQAQRLRVDQLQGLTMVARRQS